MLCFIFVLTGIMPPAVAQEVFLPAARAAIGLSQSGAPCLLRGMKVDARNPLHMDFLVDQGRSSLSAQELNDESMRSIRYFLASLTIPEKDIWVNLSPYENNRIVPDDLGRTGMGRDLLAQDYILKQLTAGLLHPESFTGKVFWAEVYRRAYDMYGTTDIPVDTFNKVWIVPSKSVVYESRSPDGKNISAFVDEMKLKVMLETDYLALVNNHTQTRVAERSPSDMARDILREVVIPVLEKEVNEGENFSMLRQVCYALTLSVWLKKKLMMSAREAAEEDATGSNILAKVFINRYKTGGIEIADPAQQTQRIYDRYVEAFKVGAYNLIKEEVDTYSQELIPRKYFSGGFFVAENFGNTMAVRTGNPSNIQGKYIHESVNLLVDKAEGYRSGDVVEFESIRPSSKRPSTFSRNRLAWFAGAALLGVVVLRSDISDRPGFITGASLPLDTQDVKNIVLGISETHQAFETGLIGREAAGIKLQDFLSGILRTKMPKGLNAQEQDSVINVWGGELARIFNDNYEQFGKDFKKGGLSVVDVARLIMAMAGKETGGKMLAVQIVNGKVQARAALQFEYATWWHQLQITKDELEQMPEEFKKFYEQMEDFYTKVQDEIKNPKGNLKNNFWESNDSEDLVALTETHIRMAMIRLNYMFKAKPLPVTAILSDADREFADKFGLELPEHIRVRLPENLLTLGDLAKEFSEEPGFSSHSLKEIGGILASRSWNGGVNFDREVAEAAVKNAFFSYEERVAFQKQANARAKEVKKELITEKGKVLAAVPKKVQRLVSMDKLFEKSGSRDEVLGKVFRQLDSDRLKKDFKKAWWAFRRVETKKLVADGLANPKSRAYSLYMYLILQGNKEDALVYGGYYRSFLRNKMDTLEKKLGENAQAVDKGQANTGGIDLAGQEDAMDVRGASGTFGLNLSPSDIKELNQDLRGFSPIIINIQPVSDVNMFLGFQGDSLTGAAS